MDWKNNPSEFEYKLSETSETQKKTITSVKEFGVDNISKYIRSIVNIDRSSDNLNNLSKDKDPIFSEEELFLKVLIEGKSSLYQYSDSDLTRYFYNIDNSKIEQLIFKNYLITDDGLAKNNRFRQQLWNDLKCSSFKMSKIERLSYQKKELINFFIEHNKCNNQNYVNFQEKQKRDLFNLTIRPRINSSSLTITNNTSNFISRDFAFDNKTGFGFGLEAEFILPFNKNKWAVAIEPTYQSFKHEKTINSSDVYGGIVTSKVNYSSIEIPISLRHYFFLNENSKIFINASYIFDSRLKYSAEFTRKDNSNLYSLDIKSTLNLGFGIGYKQNDKYSLELRLQTNRNILANYVYWDSDYKNLSLILGYSLF
ncbi:MAG TPA: outer membrane beta-barrel protein [Edaphocola sp.]|nr:outer membrane beta-barrel protein [Edaphocola sp.]